MASAVAIGATAPVAVKATGRKEAAPAAGGDWFAWSRSRERQASPYDLYAQRPGIKSFRVNPKRTQAYAGGIDGTRLLYQLIRGQLADRFASLPRGRDVDVAYAQVVSPKPPHEIVTTRIYFDQVTCGKRQKWDIYRVNDTEQLPPGP